ncbi:MORC family CW-type zinc finger protein 3 [Salmo salar]|uniref:MORC family CW-type zinc finger protein 3 n=1 Tax=Salmo salar TaxID=8030 RepID=A0A1S3PPP5_SALSA|nr:MORC family CW-type zinc finger protein 3-like [Salmo salar]
MASQVQRGVPLSALCPKFLHTNSTSHTWPFSAIAELIDNAYDPDVNAKQFWIDKTQFKGQDCLIFMDNGNGLDYEKMHKMLSFGYSDKTVINGQHPIGLYGNGFKSGSMRLGRDAIVFSKSLDGDTMHVGMLSQSYLAQIKAEQIIVPIVSFQRVAHNQFRVNEKHKASLQDILYYSLFKTENELLTELKAINSTCSMGSSGTRIIIWSLRRTLTGQTEFDFTTSSYDIRIPLDVLESTSEQYRRSELLTKPESYYSLRAYCSILYLKPRMQIVIRGQKVKTELISKSLAYIAKDYYKPNFVNRRIPITFGYNTKSKDQYGIMMYHKNRLIKPYERVGVQLKANIQGLGVIGVIECNFLEPTHNKQDFDNTDKYRKTINNLGVKLEDYWKEIRFKRDKEDPNSTVPVEDTMKRPDQNWVQCDTCLRWRKLPDGIDCRLLPEKWFCHMNPDPQFRSCMVEEEPEDSDDDQPSYQKTYKQHERNTKMQQEWKRQQYEDEQKKAERMRIAALARQNEALRRQQEDLKLQLIKTSSFRTAVQMSPASAPPTVRVNVKAPLSTRATTASPLSARPRSSPLRISPLTQSGTSPSSNHMPIISSVCSLSSPPAPSTPSRMKRTLAMTSERDTKRPRVNGFHQNTSMGTASTAAEMNVSSPSVIIPIDDDDDEITDDDDIVILETNSTPIPKKATFDMAKVKSESRSVETPSGTGNVRTNGIGTSSVEMGTAATNLSPLPPSSEQMSITTQTDIRGEVKDEEEERKKKEEVEKEKERIENRTKVKNKEEDDKKREKEERDRKRTEPGPSSAGPSSACPSSAGPSSAGPSSAGPSSAGPSSAGPSSAGPSSAGPSSAGLSSAGLSSAGPSTPGPSTPGPSTPGPSTPGPSTPGPSSAGPSSAAPSTPGPSTPGPSSAGPFSAGPSVPDPSDLPRIDFRNLSEAQEQQDQLLELMQAAAHERDQFKEQVHKLTCQLHDLEGSMQEHSRAAVKREQCHLACQTGAGDGEREQAEGSKVSDQLAVQVDTLLQDLSNANCERDMLRSQVEAMKEERGNLWSQCETLQRDVVELRREKQEWEREKQEREKQEREKEEREKEEREAAQAVAAQTERGDVAATGAANGSTSEAPQTLRELRRSIGRLLVTFVPALDLEQVNYDCPVIDEILDQVLTDVETLGPA